MSRFTIAAMLVAALSAAGCSNDNPTTPTAPTPEAVTVTFTGTLTRNGATTFPFSVSAAGTVSATLTSITDASVMVGLSLGTVPSTGAGCSVVLSNDAAVQGTSIYGTASNLGTLCARVYDVGKVVDPQDYQLTVVHF
ncbi:MAG TPA: hypothetical protein VM032_10450 [Vicinamibacterales bacterium]|nr:hypothetical protein [Vicinamibacterales bacterium]